MTRKTCRRFRYPPSSRCWVERHCVKLSGSCCRSDGQTVCYLLQQVRYPNSFSLLSIELIFVEIVQTCVLNRRPDGMGMAHEQHALHHSLARATKTFPKTLQPNPTPSFPSQIPYIYSRTAHSPSFGTPRKLGQHFPAVSSVRSSTLIDIKKIPFHSRNIARSAQRRSLSHMVFPIKRTLNYLMAQRRIWITLVA